MTILEYLTNKDTKSDREKYDKYYSLMAKQIKHQIYKYRDSVIYHVIIPSSKPGTVSYDVIIEIKTLALHPGDAAIDRLPIKVFSNCPSFVFGHAFNIKKAGWFCNWLSQKLSFNALNSMPRSDEIKPIEKSLYLAIKYIHRNQLDQISVYKTTGRNMSSLNEIDKLVRFQFEIMNNIAERIAGQRAEREQERERRQEEKNKIEEENIKKKRSHPKGVRVKPIKTTKSIKETKTLNAIGKSKSIKRTQKI